MGHLPSRSTEEDPAGEAEPRHREPEPPGTGHGNDYDDLTGSSLTGGAPIPPPQQSDYFPESPEPPAPEVPQQGERGGAPTGGQWPPPENQDWISQQSRIGGWGDQSGSWPPPEPNLAEPPAAAAPETAPDQSYRPESYLPPEQYRSQERQPPPGAYQDQHQAPDPYLAPDPQVTAGTDPYHAESAYAPPEAVPQPRRPEQAAPQPPLPGETPAGPPTEQPPSEPPPAADEGPKKVTPPPTHKGVRYAIYGIGGFITLGLIIAIVVMLGGSPASDPSDQGDDPAEEPTGQEEPEEGALSAERYAELAGAAGTAAWFDWRYGPTGENAASEELGELSGDAVATEPLYDQGDRSVQGQMGYVTDDSALSGIDHVTAVEANDGLIGLNPRAGGRFSDEGHPELELTDGSTADCVAGLGGDLGNPVALARPDQSEEADAHSVIAFSGGIIATAGISSAQGGTCVQLPDGQVPTDVALTDGNELALVTTWQPESQTGSLIVIAFSDKAGTYNSSWSESYLGLPNPGHFGDAEIVGTVELPFSAPTSVDAWSDSSGSLSLGRATIEDEPHRDTVATTGYALVGSKAEGQAAVVDLTSTLVGLADAVYDGAEFSFDASAGDTVDFGGSEIADVAVNGETLAVATSEGVVSELDRDLTELSTTELGSAPSCMVLGAQSGQFVVTSRADATVRWVSEGEVTDELSDTRLTDPVCASETPGYDISGYTGNATMLLVSDYGGQALHSYLMGEANLAGGGSVGGEGFSYAGSYEVDGNPFATSVTVDLE
ncbi:hypothetical protein [Glycomyces salinus]|uniref:hypothetical protein n=1 Tax=Glycomyces salinus TaxID=980294 RepID=UPI0018ED3419|nr:hypothetical protein [Glycomyces salinus]